MATKVFGIEGPVASGKTTRALERLEAQGGGVIVSSYPQQISALIMQHGFKGISVVYLEQGGALVIDDSNDKDITIVTVEKFNA